jgi:transcription elongation GreA/GreB family factor
VSRAFIKEKDGDAPDDGLPDRPESGEPNYVTPQGLEDLKRQLAEATAEQARLAAARESSKSKSALARLARDIRYLEHRIGNAIVSEPTSADEIAIGATVIIDDGARHMTFTIVGEDQADPAAGFVSWTSPLGRALVGAKRGAKVVWTRPLGDIEVTVVDFKS